MAATFKFNPFTGTFDIVGTSGGGGGTVTSITAGTGLEATATNPITTAGTISLDIDSLTHEPTLAAGDEFAFVDVSVGTAPADQRKVTFAEIEAALVVPPSGAAGGDLSGTYPNPTVAKINTVALGTTTATSGHLLIADGSAWQSVAMSADATIASSGALTLASIIVAGGPTGDATTVPVITWDAKGRLTAVTTATISGTTPGGSAGGDLSGTYPNPTVAKINTVALGTTTATSGHILVADGSAWQSVAMSGDATLAASGALTLASVIVAGGPTGSSTQIPVITWDAKGRLLAVTTAAAATGTVTSVAGGVGITNSPEPITTTGTVDLDINSLTTETTVASGDLFAMVDVSVGTSPSSQRKVTAGSIVSGITPLIDHNSLANLTVGDPHTQYAYLAGRAGGQTLKGGTVAAVDRLTLYANAVDTGSIAQLYGGGPDAFFVVGPGDSIPTGDATIIANASDDPGAYPGFHLQNNGVDHVIIQYRPNAIPNETADFIFAGELHIVSTPGNSATVFSQNGDIDVTGDGAGGGLLSIVSSTGTTPAFLITSSSVFSINGNGNITALNSVVTTCPTVNAAGVLHNDGSGTWSWSKVSLTVDVTGTLPIANGGTGQTSALAAFNALSPLTTRGDLLTRDATNNIRKGIGAANTVLGSDGTDIQWVAAGAKGGGLPTCTNTQTLRATGTDTWAASSVLTNDGTNLVDSGTLTVQGASITGGTAGTAFTATLGQGAAGTDGSTLTIQSGNGSGADAILSMKRNTTEQLKFTGAAGLAGTPTMTFATILSILESGGATSLALTASSAVFGTAGTAETVTVGSGTTSTDASTLVVRSGNSGTTAPSMKLQRNTTEVARWTYDGTDNFFDYIGNLKFRSSIAGTAKFVLDTNGVLTTYRNQATAGNGVPSELSSIALTAQTANIAATNLVASTAAAGMYRATLHYCTTTAGNAVTITGQINYTSDVTNTALNFIGATIAINTLDAKVTTSFTFQARSGTAITYQTNQSGALGAGRYALYIILERLS